MASRKRRRSGRPPVEGVMGRSNVEFDAAMGEMPGHTSSDHDPVRRFFAVLPRPLRFLGVGGLGLITDLAVFTLIIAQTPHPLLARLVSLAIATLVTWRLNRALTFDHSGRHSAPEAMRYAAVFAALIVTVLAAMPQLAVIVGAACGALVSYSGQALFAFRPRTPSPRQSTPV